MKRINLKSSLFIACLFFTGQSFGQTNNLDLLSGKELAEMSRLNPAFTAVMNELRLNTSRGGDVSIGLEGKWFRSPTHFGLYFQQNSIDNLDRNTLNFQLSRDRDFKGGFQFKYALQLQYDNKKFTGNNSSFPLNFNDFNGLQYSIDSSNFGTVLSERKTLDVGIGVGGLYKTLIFGANLRHLNAPKASIIDGSAEKLPIGLDAQLGGFLSIFGTDVFPHVLLSAQGDDLFLSGGVGITKKNVTFMGQFEQINDQTQLDLGLNFRYERFMFAVNYVYPQVSNYEFAFSDIRFTLNTTLRKPRIKDQDFLNKLRKFY